MTNAQKTTKMSKMTEAQASTVRRLSEQGFSLESYYSKLALVINDELDKAFYVMANGTYFQE